MAGDLKLWLPLVYLLIALLVWINFMRLPPDGLASLGLWLTVLPIMLLDLVLRPADRPGISIFLPDRFGYYMDHTVFFVLGVAVIALTLFALGAALDRRA